MKRVEPRTTCNRAEFKMTFTLKIYNDSKFIAVDNSCGSISKGSFDRRAKKKRISVNN